MSKKTIFITISIILVIFLISLIGYYFILGNTGNSSSEKTPVFKNFFPFGGNDNLKPATTTIASSPKQPEQPKINSADFTKKLRKITSEQVSGEGTLDVKPGTVVRYIEKATGHIYETELFSPRNQRISNTTIPTVYDALWGNNAMSIMARYLKDDNQTVDTYSLTLKNVSTSTENIISGILFSDNTSDVSVFGTKVFYLLNGDSSSDGYISNFDGSKTTKIWSSKIKELTSQFVNTKTVALTTKPAQNIPGFMYFVDTTNGQVRKILSDVYGLSDSVNNDNTKVLYVSQTDSLKMYMLDIKTSVSTKITPETFPEKCVWSKKNTNIFYCAVPKQSISGSSLINWYLGAISYNDYIYRYDISTDSISLILDLTIESGEEIDVIKPILSENERYLIFINKKDNSLWSLNLTQ